MQYEINRIFAINYLSLLKMAFLNRKKLIPISGFAALVLLLALSLTARNQTTPPAKQTAIDTVPKREKKIKDLDEALLELDKSHIEIEKSLKSIDWSKIEKDINESLRNIDVSKINADVKNALKEIDVAKLKAEIDASIAKIDFDKIKVDIEKIKEIDLEKIRVDIEKIKPDIELTIKGAKEGIEKAKKELTEYKSFVDDLEKDGLINKKEPYTIEHKKAQLIINGKVQPADVYARYRLFLEKHEGITIKKTADDFDIDEDK
jgi:copper chaperone CopZ